MRIGIYYIGCLRHVYENNVLLMAATRVSEYSVSYELVGDQGRPWVITPGGRFSKDSPGVRELALALAERGNRVLIWDRPNCLSLIHI